MNSHKLRTLAALAAVVILGVMLAACARAASTAVIPTSNVPTLPASDATNDANMNAISTELAIQATQTAFALGVGGGGEGTLLPVNPIPGAETPTPTIPPVIIEQPTPTPVPPVAVSCSNPYTVKQGDWIYKIARECHVEPSAVLAANPGIAPNYIKPGQQIVMPAAGATAVPPATPQACTGSHTVVRGETLFRIAYNCGLTSEEMARLNNIPYPYVIQPGQVLRFP